MFSGLASLLGAAAPQAPAAPPKAPTPPPEPEAEADPAVVAAQAKEQIERLREGITQLDARKERLMKTRPSVRTALLLHACGRHVLSQQLPLQLQQLLLLQALALLPLLLRRLLPQLASDCACPQFSRGAGGPRDRPGPLLRAAIVCSSGRRAPCAAACERERLSLLQHAASR